MHEHGADNKQTDKRTSRQTDRQTRAEQRHATTQKLQILNCQITTVLQL